MKTEDRVAMSVMTDNIRIAKAALDTGLSVLDADGREIENIDACEIEGGAPVSGGLFRIMGNGVVQGEHVSLYSAHPEEAGHDALVVALANVDAVWIDAGHALD